VPDLSLTGVVTGYGSVPVLHGIDLEVSAGEAAVILGANGAGKTTILQTVAGFVRPWRGRVTFDGRDIGRLAPERIVALGVGVVPPAPGVFRELSVLDNLRVGGFALGRDRRRVQRRLDEILADLPGFGRRLNQIAGRMSGGEQRLLAVARALMGEPRLLLVDEASMGLSPAMFASVLRLLDRVRREGVTLCLVEQNHAALDIADRAYVIAKGGVVHAARGAGIASVRAAAADAYLGTPAPTGR
jgi:branched-chain amino acid transport system ATP-binding protein